MIVALNLLPAIRGTRGEAAKLVEQVRAWANELEADAAVAISLYVRELSQRRCSILRALCDAAAPPSAPVVPEGWKLVPSHMDVAMIGAFWKRKNTGGSDVEAYADMLAASPTIEGTRGTP